ncbi:MAG: PAS domain S-box protein [Bacteroidota bacterium]
MESQNQTIRILFVEDLLTDAELAQRELKKENINFSGKIVDTEKEFVTHLQEFSPDIIISDYSMPYFDGMSALKITQSFNHYIPFIVLTGSVNEETAVACMKAGADDYVLKENITRLPFAVLEAIKKNKNRIEKEKMQQQVINSLEEYQDLFNNMNETVWIIHPNGELLDVNDTAVNKLGFSKDELLEKGIIGIDAFLSKDKIKQLISAMPKDETQIFETWHKCKNGTQIPVEISSTVIRYQGEKAILSVARDITERVENQRALYEAEQKYRNLAESIGAILWEYDITNDQWTYVAPQVLDLLGYKPKQWHNFESWKTKIHPEDKNNVLNYYQQIIENSIDQSVEYRLKKQDGNFIWIQDHFKVEYDQGKAKKLRGLMLDISQRKKAEKTQYFLYKIATESLNASNLKKYLKYIHHELKQIIKAENFSIALYDKQKDAYSIPFFKDKYDNFNNYTSISLKNTLTDYVRRTGKPQLITAEKEKEISEKEPIQLVGTPSPVWIGAPIIDASKNEVIGVIILQDYEDPNAYNYDDLNTLKIISANIGLFIDRVKNLEQLQLMRKAIEQNPTSITIVDANNIIQYVNPSFCQITGYSPDQVIGKDTTFLRSGLYTEDFYQTLWETLYSGKDWIGEFNNKRANGELYWEEAIISPIVNENGETTHFIKVSEDVTEKKKMLEDLKEAKEKAEESDRLKSAFLANISHEIRTPMNGVLGFINLLNEPDLDDSTRNEYIQIVNKSGNRLLETINNIIEVSKIEAGESQVTYENIKINNIMNYLYDFFKIQTDKKNITLQTGNQISGNKGLIRTDKQKVEGMLSNLIKNAIKFTHEGFIEFGNYIENNFLVFYVKDTGIGIPEDKQEVIFERFGQADIKLTRDHEGSGIGLSIVKSYAENLGGKVWLSSELNKGSTFYFSIPYTPVWAEKTDKSSTEKEPADDKKLGKQTILIAEDNQSSYKLLEALLSNEEITLIHSKTGKETILKLKQNPEISIILMDIKMPDMDGLEATKEIRKFNKTIPIIAQSAYALHGDKEKAIKSGCNDYITKPINKEDLHELIHKYS